MRYRTLGKTGLNVSVLGFGASSLGGVFRDVDPAEGTRAVRRAVDLGINYFDVSPYYGLTLAEERLGKALKGIGRDQLVLSTKAGRYGESDFDMSYDRITRSLEESLSRLGTDYVDILFLHDIEFVPLEVVVEDGLRALADLKRQGKARFIGVSGLPLSVFVRTLERADLDVILSYCHYSLNDTSLMDIVPLLDQRKVGVVNASPLAMGLFSDRGAPAWHPAGAHLRARCMEAVNLCRARGSDAAKLAIQFATANEVVSTTLFSTANPANVDKNVRWLDEPVDELLLRSVLAVLAPVHNETWSSGLKEYAQP
jgi:aryl-alcohol dehydrogenase-like predicted oxidoreductase